MKHTYIIALVALMTACGSQQSAERTEDVPSSIQLPAVAPSPAATVTVDQDANATIAPGPVQPTTPIAATPLPTPVPIVTPAPTPTPSATPTPTQCSQFRSDGNYDYTCGLWVISAPMGAKCPASHASEMELTQSNGQLMNGSYVVMLYSDGGISWDGGNVSISSEGSGMVYVTVPGAAGRGPTQVPCLFTVSPAN